MFQFEHPEFFWAFAAFPLMIAFFVMTGLYRKRAMQRFGENSLLMQLMPEYSTKKHLVKFIIFMIAMTFLVIAWTNPQRGTKKQKVKRESVDVFIALDLSKSMLAQDIAPNRMERAKRFVSDLTDALKGNRIGTVIFAGNAYLQMPLTTDYSAAKMFARSANTQMVPSQGTALKEAIKIVMESFERDDKHQKALVIVTDGEDHEKEVVELASEALADGIVIYTVGVGTIDGAPIPVFENGVERMKRDIGGEIVTTRLNEDMLRNVAKAGGGNYFNIKADRKIISKLKERVEQLDKRSFEQRVFETYDSYFQIPLFIGILLIVLEFMLDFRKSRWWGSRDIFDV